MAAKDAYKRGKSGYSVKDEKEAAAYRTRVTAENKRALVEKAQGKAGFTGGFDKTEAEAQNRRSEQHYLENTKTPRGREINRANVKFMRDQVTKLKDVNAHKKGSK
jgi:hypothetical protein